MRHKNFNFEEITFKYLYTKARYDVAVKAWAPTFVKLRSIQSKKIRFFVFYFLLNRIQNET